MTAVCSANSEPAAPLCLLAAALRALANGPERPEQQRASSATLTWPRDVVGTVTATMAAVQSMGLMWMREMGTEAMLVVAELCASSSSVRTRR